MIPNIDECYKLLQQEEVPSNIVCHSEKVALVSLFIGCFLNKAGENLNLPLLVAGGLLHDIKKQYSILKGGNHAELGYKFLKKLGYDEVASIVGSHIFLTPGPPFTPIKEKEIVYYADKRVKHGEIVSLEERFRYFRKRYGKNIISHVRLELIEELSFLLERRLFKKLPFSPDKILELNKIKEVKGVLIQGLKDCSSCWRDIF
ncbi:MAG: hypothetical protein DRP29_03140 [Thermodesulfobacteriota bacterium]|nr:MAG: hypothetical protein DRP29_03140 [Thermodesulfobacteriota bacterium]RLG11379.1 MAG: hypothetical protein DRN73_05525 [Candidatus Pacearchaeota archaeon]